MKGWLALGMCLVAACGDDAESKELDARVGVGDAARLDADVVDARVEDAELATPTDASVADASIADVDLTLGGFNQDLPAPSVDCVNARGTLIGCVAITGTYNDEAFAFACDDKKVVVGTAGSHIVGCRGPTAGGEIVIELRLERGLIAAPPRAFALSAPSSRSYVSEWQFVRGFASYPDGVFALAATHDQSIRVAGISELVRLGSATSPYDEWQIRGTYGLILTPKSTCTPDGAGKGCDTIRVRASFLAHPLDS